MVHALYAHRSKIATIALDDVGGALFYAVNLPLPWMLSAIFVTLVGTLTKWNLTGPEKARPLCGQDHRRDAWLGVQTRYV